MSGTRPDSPQAQVTRGSALLIAAHGDCGGEGGNLLASELARRIRKARCFDEVDIGFMRGKPTIEEATSHFASTRVRIYPLFMSDGYYVRDAIPQRLGIKDGRDAFGHLIVVDPPLGLHPELPKLLAGAAQAYAHTVGLRPAVTSLLLVAHGSRTAPESALVAEAIRSGISGLSIFKHVGVALLEEAPLLLDALKACPRPVIVLGLFAGNGMHADEDVRSTILSLNDQSVHVVEQLGGFAQIIELVAASLCSGAAMMG